MFQIKKSSEYSGFIVYISPISAPAKGHTREACMMMKQKNCYNFLIFQMTQIPITLRVQSCWQQLISNDIILQVVDKFSVVPENLKNSRA